MKKSYKLNKVSSMISQNKYLIASLFWISVEAFGATTSLCSSGLIVRGQEGLKQVEKFVRSVSRPIVSPSKGYGLALKSWPIEIFGSSYLVVEEPGVRFAYMYSANKTRMNPKHKYVVYSQGGKRVGEFKLPVEEALARDGVNINPGLSPLSWVEIITDTTTGNSRLVFGLRSELSLAPTAWALDFEVKDSRVSLSSNLNSVNWKSPKTRSSYLAEKDRALRISNTFYYDLDGPYNTQVLPTSEGSLLWGLGGFVQTSMLAELKGDQLLLRNAPEKLVEFVKSEKVSDFPEHATLRLRSKPKENKLRAIVVENNDHSRQGLLLELTADGPQVVHRRLLSKGKEHVDLDEGSTVFRDEIVDTYVDAKGNPYIVEARGRMLVTSRVVTANGRGNTYKKGDIYLGPENKVDVSSKSANIDWLVTLSLNGEAHVLTFSKSSAQHRNAVLALYRLSDLTLVSKSQHTNDSKIIELMREPSVFKMLGLLNL